MYDKLDNLEHIKKYKSVQKMYSEIMEDMTIYFKKNKKYVDEKMEQIRDITQKEAMYDHDLYFDDQVKADVLCDAFYFRNNKNITCILDDFIKKDIYKKEQDKKALLEALSNSRTDLFRIVRTDKENGYIYLESVFNKNSTKIIDIAMSDSLNWVNTTSKKLYLFTRIFNYENVDYATDMKLIFQNDNKALKGFIEKSKKKKLSNLGILFNLCIIYDKSSDTFITINNMVNEG